MYTGIAYPTKLNSNFIFMVPLNMTQIMTGLVN